MPRNKTESFSEKGGFSVNFIALLINSVTAIRSFTILIQPFSNRITITSPRIVF